MINKKYSYNEVSSLFKKYNYQLIDKEYNGCDVLLNYKCSQGHEHSMKFSHFKEGRRCPTCKKEKNHRGFKFSYEEVKQEFQLQGYTLLSKNYVRSINLLKCLCPNGHNIKIRFSNFRKGHRCWVCTHTSTKKEKIKKRVKKDIKERKQHPKKLSINQLIPIFLEKNLIILDTKYKNSATPLKCKCKICNNEVYSSVDGIKDKRRIYFCKYCKIRFYRGPKHHSWKKELTEEDRLHTRKYDEYLKWRKNILKKDNYTCQITNKRGGNLVVHHLDSYAKFPKLRLKKENGITLLPKIHLLFHNTYGIVTTKNQFYEFKNLIEKGEICYD